jgi:glucoamylase
VQLDEVAFPLVMAWQLRRIDATTYRDHVKPAADHIVAYGP